MEYLMLFLSTFAIVFIGELGDKTQIAAGSGALSNKDDKVLIFLGSAGALVLVAGITTFFTNLIPQEILPLLTQVGGVLLIAYSLYLYYKLGDPDHEEGSNPSKNGLALFFSQFAIVFMNELGDKTQFATLSIALENTTRLWTVFFASSLALVTVTGITILGVSLIPRSYVKKVQFMGATMLLLFGFYMIFS